MMNLFGENHADAIDWAQHGGQGYTFFSFPPKLQIFASIQNYGCLARTVSVRRIILWFSIHIFVLQRWIYILWFPICFQLFSLTNSLHSWQQCLLISVPTCCKLTFATCRLNLSVLASIDLLIMFEKYLQKLRSFQLSQHGIGDITSFVFSQITAFTSNYHRNTKWK